MRIIIGRRKNGVSQVMLVPARGRPLAPLMLSGVTKENLREEVGKAYTAMLGASLPPPA